MVHIPRWGFWAGPVEPSLGNPDPLALGCASDQGFWISSGGSGAEFADAELMSHGTGGVSFKAEVPLAAVVSSHLLSLGAGCAGDAAQVDLFVGPGLYTAHDSRLGGADGALFAYFPCRCVPQGATQRRGDPGRPWRTSDHGAPRCKVEADGKLVL